MDNQSGMPPAIPVDGNDVNGQQLQIQAPLNAAAAAAHPPLSQVAGPVQDPMNANAVAVAQQDPAVAVLAPLQQVVRMFQESQQIQKEEKAVAARVAKQQEEESAKKAALESSRQECKGLKNETLKANCYRMIAIGGIHDDADRAKLIKAVIEIETCLETDVQDIEEANANLENATKKCASLTKEQQEEIYKQLKAKKRKTTSESDQVCSRCGRTNHSMSECYAATHKNGKELSDDGAVPPGKRAGGRGGASSRSGMGSSFVSAAGPPFFGNSFMNTAGFQPTGYGMQPTMPVNFSGQQSQQSSLPFSNHMMPMNMMSGSNANQGGARPPVMCYYCHQLGHRQNQCPLFIRQGNTGSVSGPGPNPNMIGNAGVSNTQQFSCQEFQTMSSNMSDSMYPRECVSNGLFASCCVPDSLPLVPIVNPTVPFKRADDNINAQVAVLPPISTQTSPLHGSEPVETTSESDSIASLYSNYISSLHIDSNNSNPSPNASLHDLVPQSEPITDSSSCIISPSYNLSSSNSVAQISQLQSANSTSTNTTIVSELEEQLVAALELTGMPGIDISLRHAIRHHFASKKKVLSDQVSVQQMCSHCEKRGHTVEGCPDRNQSISKDKSVADRWVRNLMSAPRVNIHEVNKGLSLQEGVNQWLIRGEQFNVDNPWRNSTRREDALRRQLGFHKALGMSAVHLGWIGFGVPLQFANGVEPAVLAFRNHKSVEEESDFVDKEHKLSLADGSFVEVERNQLKGICPLQVEKHPVSGKRRLCQDLRWINGHIPHVEFKMESLFVELGDIVRRGDKLFTTDIEKAYYCVPLHPDAMPYLGWQWKGKYYMPRCLVFGLSIAPRVFTKIMRPMMAFMRSLAVRVLGMIDDYMWSAQPNGIPALKQSVKIVLPTLGWKLNAKCIWEAADEVLMLGMLINTKEFTVKAPEKKVKAALSDISELLRMGADTQCLGPSIRQMQQVTGRLMSMMLAFSGVRIFTRELYKGIAIAMELWEQRKSLRGIGRDVLPRVQLTSAIVEELKFWSERLKTHNGARINSRENQIDILLWSDASDLGWGGEVTLPAGSQGRLKDANSALSSSSASAATVDCHELVNMMEFGSLPFQEISHSSTRRELVGLLELVNRPRILRQLTGKRVKVMMDSVPALRNLINGGGSKSDLVEAVRKWTVLCEQFHIEPVYEWVPRADNWRADKASKLYHQQHSFATASNETMVRDKLAAVVGDHAVARARAQLHNRWLGKVPIFLPMFHQVDARVEMIRATLKEAIIVVPEWPSGGATDWFRRIKENSLGWVFIGMSNDLYSHSNMASESGHNERLVAFWLVGRSFN